MLVQWDVVSIPNMLAHSPNIKMSLKNAPFETRTTTPTILTDDFRGFLSFFRQIQGNFLKLGHALHIFYN
jgi:hypothetical protein